jgi:hypothetical protein
LSQGVMDIVVKLFVLAQLRALALGKERITEGLLRQVYEDELIPVHPMLAALRSGIPDKIAQYSDLMVPEMDKRLIQLQQDIAAIKEQTAEEKALQQLATEDERRLYLLLANVYDSSLLLPTVRKVFKENPGTTMADLLPIVSQWLSSYADSNNSLNGKCSNTKEKVAVIKPNNWDELALEDLRFIKSQCKSATEVHATLREQGIVLDLASVLNLAS